MSTTNNGGKTSEIRFHITLDENKVPEKINWSATDGGIDQQDSDAIMLSVWDGKSQDTLRIDLWTKDLMVHDMKKFFHQTLRSMADTLERATNEHKMADDMRDFATYFAEQLKLT